MYCNLFDTVRTRHWDYVQFEGVFFHTILSGYRPTLSINQVVDSAAMMSLCHHHKEFIDFFDKGVIRVSLLKDFRSVEDYLAYNLKSVDGAKRNPYKFSSLPFLYNNYDDNQIQKIYNAMTKVITGDSHRVTTDLFSDADHADALNESLSTIRTLSDRLSPNYVSPSRQPNPVLSRRIDSFIDSVHQQRPEMTIPPILLNLEEYFKELREDHGLNPDGSQDFRLRQLDSRSHMYSMLDEFSGSFRDLSAEAKAIIDMCYNERVAASICDGEDELMVTDPLFPSLDYYVKTDAKEQQIHTISPYEISSPYATPFMSWEALALVYEMASNQCHQPQKLRETLARCCEEVGLPRFDPSQKIADQKIVFSATVLQALSKNEWLISNSSDISEVTKQDNYYWEMDISHQKQSMHTAGQSHIVNASLKSDYAKEND